MNYRWLGAVFIILGCGSFGFSIAAKKKQEERILHNMVDALNFMKWELQYRMTPLPELCRMAATDNCGVIRLVLNALADEIEKQVMPDAASCMQVILNQFEELPRTLKGILKHLGCVLGRFDLPGQLEGLNAVEQKCNNALKRISENQNVRLRSYETIGICTGIALAILFI